MKTTPRTALAAVAGAAGALIGAGLAARFILRPHPAPAEMAKSVIDLEAIGWKATRYCPLRCPHRDEVHVHAISPGGLMLAFSPPTRRKPGTGPARVYFTPYTGSGPRPDSLLEAEPPAGPVEIRATSYEDYRDHCLAGDDRIVIYYQVSMS